jgi:glyoxylase-like metal-dependent hydrolase (beta-lactamase superfamily II)
VKRAIAAAILVLWAVSGWAQTASMTAHFINIGQGESVLLEFLCGAMLIDAGAQDAAARTRLVAYLNKFFTRRTDLHRTLNTILITHDHIDHDAALRAVIENFTVEHFVDNGMLTGLGAPNPKWLRNEITSGHRHVEIEEIPDSDVEAVADKTGFTSARIDPVNCGTVDPQIRVLQGRIDPNPGGVRMRSAT